MVGVVEQHLTTLLTGGPLHFTLIDPEKSPGPRAAGIARDAAAAGSHAILLGGSTGISPEVMGEAARQIRAAVPLPTIIFPEGSGSLTSGAHAVLFMSMLNSRNLGLVIRTQARAAPVVRRLGLEPIPMGYLVIAPGMRVGEVGEADLVGREEHERAQGYALAAEMLGMRFVYLEAGSGAPAPVPEAMVRAVRSVLTVPLVVGGGIRSGPEAARLLAAGAQVLVTGTITEEEGIGSGFRSILT
ncbi:Geranylgeranylglyceryl phosphate synthase, partial [mine drainage metagenome]